MSQQSQNTSLSLSARLLCYLGPPSSILLTASASPKTALLSPLALIIPAAFLRKWQNLNRTHPSQRGELEPMLWTFVTAGTLGLTGVALVQVAIVKAASRLLFTSDVMRKEYWAEFGRGTIAGLTTEELVRRSTLASSWQNWTFNLIFTFIAAGLAEETLKYLPIIYARQRGTVEERRIRKREYVDYAIAGALGFSVVETIGFIYAAIETGNETPLRLAFSVFERLVGQIGHLSMSGMTALRAIRRDYHGERLSWWDVVGPAVLFHGAFDFVCFSGSALEGNVGWIHPSGLGVTTAMIGTALSLIGGALWEVGREWNKVKSLEAQEQAIILAEKNKTQN